MSFELAKNALEAAGLGARIMIFEKSSATVEEAAAAVGCEPCQIAKTMSFLTKERPVLIVTAGDAKVDNRKYKDFFHEKARMIPGGEVEKIIGHAPGGVCPFGIRPGIAVYLDVSLRRFSRVYPAAGSGHSAADLTLPELEQSSRAAGWVDVCKGWTEV